MENQSMAFWCLNALLTWIKQEGFVPGDPGVFDELVSSLSLALVNSTSSLASLATCIAGKRRESYLSHFPANVGGHFKTQLQGSSFQGKHLFEEEVLTRVMGESREDLQAASNARIASWSFPVFGAGKAGRQASGDQSSQASSSTTSYRGKGKGAAQAGQQGVKRSSSPGRGRGRGKKARGGNPPAGRGRGFR